MNIIIAGCGKVGSTLVRQLSSEGYDITIIDSNAAVLENSVDRYDVIGIHGNFDDAQTAVKKVFADQAFRAELAKKKIRLTSANSINIGRLTPQIVY